VYAIELHAKNIEFVTWNYEVGNYAVRLPTQDGHIAATGLNINTDLQGEYFGIDVVLLLLAFGASGHR
jgi:hypothetical protein